MPLGVNCQTEPFMVYTCWYLPSADSMKRASRNRWHIERAISFAIENVVVVVVVTIREGSLGSGMRLDWENLSEPKLLIASSDRKVCSTLVKRTRWAESGSRLTISVAKRSLKSCRLLSVAELRRPGACRCPAQYRSSAAADCWAIWGTGAGG